MIIHNITIVTNNIDHGKDKTFHSLTTCHSFHNLFHCIKHMLAYFNASYGMTHTRVNNVASIMTAQWHLIKLHRTLYGKAKAKQRRVSSWPTSHSGGHTLMRSTLACTTSQLAKENLTAVSGLVTLPCTTFINSKRIHQICLHLPSSKNLNMTSPLQQT